MRAIVQRVNHASLSVDGRHVSSIGTGFLVLVGFNNDDDVSKVDCVVDRIVNMRIFRDDAGKLNLSLKDVGGEVMCVSNFTLYGNPASGRRPDFSHSAHYDVAKPLYDHALKRFEEHLGKIAPGAFGEHMHIDTSLDGPVTMVVEK